MREKANGAAKDTKAVILVSAARILAPPLTKNPTLRQLFTTYSCTNEEIVLQDSTSEIYM